MPEIKSVLGFDFGSKSIGVAIGQTTTKSASPLTALANQPPKLWQQIAALIQEWQPDALIVGLPLNMDGSQQHITQAAKKFGATLSQKFSLPVYYADERLSTTSAKEILFQQGGYKKLSKAKIDSTAAALIVSAWLEEN